MALTVTTDLTTITDAETVTGWTAIGAQSPALEPDFFSQGANCISRAVSNSAKGMYFTSSAIDFTTGTHKDKLVYIWMRSSTPGLCATRASAGVVVRIGNSGSVYRDWYVDGSDTIVATEGWTCYVIDPQSAGTATTGAYNANAITIFGGYMTTTAAAKGQNFGIDAIRYGRGELRVTGTNTTSGAGFKEISAADFGTINNRYGIITEKQGIYYIKGKIVIGHASTNTDFSSRNETVVYETPSYYNGTNVVKAIPDASVGATAGSDGLTTYNGLSFIGGTGTTTITLGAIVGTDNGRSGTTFTCATNEGLTTPSRTTAQVSATDSTMALSLYGSTFTGFDGGVDLFGTNLTNDDNFGNTYNACGRLRSNMEIRNAKVLNSVAATDDGAYIWESTSNIQDSLFVNNSRAIVFESNSFSPVSMVGIEFGSNTFDVRNESNAAITLNISGGGGSPSTENIASATTTVVNSKTFTINNIIDGSEVRIFRASDSVELGGAEIVGASPSGLSNVTVDTDPDNSGRYLMTYSYGYVSDTNVFIMVVHNSYQILRVNYILKNSDSTLLVSQITDRQYNNP